MKKLISIVLIIALLAPSFASAVSPIAYAELYGMRVQQINDILPEEKRSV